MAEQGNGGFDAELKRIEQAIRWRLVLGRFADDRLGLARFGGASGAEGEGGDRGDEGDGGDGGEGPAGARRSLGALLGEAGALDVPLEYLYDRAFAQRSHRQGSVGPSHGLSVPMWIKNVRSLFPAEAVRVMEDDALTRYGLEELITDPETLRRAEPDEALLKTILQFKHRMKGEVLEIARGIVAAVVRQLTERLETECLPSLHGVHDPEGRPPRRTFRNVDWHKTVRKNLGHYDPEAARLVVERLYYRHRQRQRSPWHIIVSVDQSGSMTDSLIHAAVMSAIFASLPSVRVSLVLWDTRVVDVSHLAAEPLEVLMSCQLGGGTDMLPALSYAAGLVQEPRRSLLVLISDWFIGDAQAPCLALAQELHASGVTCIGLSALDAACQPVYDASFAQKLAGCGWFVAALTPQRLAEHVGKLLL
ncbi:MAG: VWA domain-containing protein [Myxococcales bacterium]|nr:VWA domain-containing protein [Myxococcales bacterium]